MAIAEQQVTDDYAVYLGDCIETMAALPDTSAHLSVYSPPFGGLYHYSSDDRDLSNANSREEFFDHYTYVVKQIARLMMPGRIVCVHCMDIPQTNGGVEVLYDFPGDIIRLHQDYGMLYTGRNQIWKEPLAVRNRTMMKKLAHKTIVTDSSRAGIASADTLLTFRMKGENQIPVVHPTGLDRYAGAAEVPAELHRYRGHVGHQIENRYSHWIWRRYASSVWDDIRLDRVLPFKQARDEDDERHVHPLQLDVIERCVQLWSNPGETVLTPFMGVGSEVFGALELGRKAIGIELKPSYYRQALRNIAEVGKPIVEQPDLFAFDSADDSAEQNAETE